MGEQQPQSNIEELIHVPDRSKLHSFEVMIKRNRSIEETYITLFYNPWSALPQLRRKR